MNLPPQTIITQNIDQIVIELNMLPALDAFHDHFPDHPILPGVVQLDWAIKLASQYLGLRIVSARDFQIKFRSIIRPAMLIKVTLKHDRTQERLSFEYRHQGEIMSSGTIKLKDVT